MITGGVGFGAAAGSSGRNAIGGEFGAGPGAGGVGLPAAACSESAAWSSVIGSSAASALGSESHHRRRSY